MTVLIGSGNSNIAVPPPTVIPSIKNNMVQTTTNVVFPMPANDGTSFVFNNGENCQILSVTNTVVHSYSPSSVNASANSFAGFWLDTVNGYIWLLATASGSAGHGYLGYINISTGIMTAVGSGFTGPVGTLPSGFDTLLQVERASIGSGDLTFWNGTYNFSVSTTTGAITVAESQLLLNSIGLASSINELWYATLDKTLFAQIGLAASSINQGQMIVFRNGRQLSLVFDTSATGGFNASNGVLRSLPWGNNQVWVTSLFNGSLPFGAQMFNRASFDAWLQNIATSAGMP